MAAVNPAVAGGPVGGNMMMMPDGSPATQGNEVSRTQLNTYIYDYFLRLGMHDVARSLQQQGDKFKLKLAPKQSPGRRKDGEANGAGADAMDVDNKLDIPDDLPHPALPESPPHGQGFLMEWFSIFSDIYVAARGPKQQGGSINPAQQYLMHAQNMQRMRENSTNMMRPGMNPNQFMRANMRNGMMNGGGMPNAEMAKRMTPQQMAMMQQKQMQQQQQQQMQRGEGGDVEMNGRPGTPAEGDNTGSPSKRPRLEGQAPFNGNMMANGRPMPAGVPQGMMIQNAFNPQAMNPQQFRPNNGMPQKQPMQPAMPNGGMMNMNNAGSPMMVGMPNGQFGNDAALEMYNSGRMGGQMQGGATPQSGNHALQDYQMQLMLLEQQNKKRLMMARQEQDNQVQRDGAPMGVMGGTGMSPSGSRSGTSPNPADQMKRTPQLGGLPGSPSAGENMQGRSPAAMNFMNGSMPAGDFGNPVFMGDGKGMGGPGGPNMRPPTSMNMPAGAMNRQFQGGQPMAQQPSQGGQPMGTPGQRNEMPPPQAPAGNAQRNQASSPAQSGGNAPPTPSQTNKANPKKKAKDDNASNTGSTKKKPNKKNSQANAANSENQTPTPANATVPPAPVQQQMPPAQNPMPQSEMSQNVFPDFNGAENFNLDFSTLDNADVLETFDFDSFLNQPDDGAFNFESGMPGNDFGLDAGGD